MAAASKTLPDPGHSHDTALAHLDTALAAEREGQVFLFGTQDFAEGTAAFREKRAPRYSGR